MENANLTIKRFMWMDILVLTILAIIVDVVAYLITGWVAQETLEEGLMESVFIAPGLCFVFLLYCRWGKFGIVPNLVVIITQLILYNQQIFSHYSYVFIVIFGYLSFILSLLVFYFIIKKHFENWLTLSTSFIAIYAVMITVEWFVSFILGGSLTWDANSLRHIINVVISTIIIIVMAAQKKMFTDMKSHLIKLHEKEDFS